MFVCPECHKDLHGIPPNQCTLCKLPNITGDLIYLFSDEKNINLKGSNQYIGFDTLAEKYDVTRNLDDDIRDKIGFHIKNNINSSETALDIGAGTGNFTFILNKIFRWVIAGDISLNMLEKIRAKMNLESNNNIIPCKMNIYDIPIKSGVLDTVFAVNVLHLINNPDAAIKEIKRVLGKNKIFISIYFKEINEPENDIHTEIEELYYEELEKAKILTLSVKNLPESGLHDYLTTQFNKYQLIETEDLIWKSKSTPIYGLEQVLSKQNPDQLLIDQKIHEKISKKIIKKMENKYGNGFREFEIENILQVSIGFYCNE